MRAVGGIGPGLIFCGELASETRAEETNQTPPSVTYVQETGVMRTPLPLYGQA